VGQRRTAAVLLMTADVLMFILSYGDTRPMVAIYPRWPIIDYIREHNPDGHRVFDAEGQSAGDWCFLGPGSPVASVYGVPSILGFNPLDVARYRQFLAVIAGHREPLQAFSSDFAHPVVRGCQVYDRRLVDLAGVRYFIQSPRFWYGNTVSEVDSLPWASSYNFLGKGVEDLPQTSLLENLTVMPPPFVVNEVVPQEPEHRVIAQLHTTDVRRVAFLDEWSNEADPIPKGPAPPGPATIQAHRPNQIDIALDGRTAGLLVLTDPWYPGWVCRI